MQVVNGFFIRSCRRWVLSVCMWASVISLSAIERSLNAFECSNKFPCMFCKTFQAQQPSAFLPYCRFNSTTMGNIFRFSAFRCGHYLHHRAFKWPFSGHCSTSIHHRRVRNYRPNKASSKFATWSGGILVPRIPSTAEHLRNAFTALWMRQCVRARSVQLNSDDWHRQQPRLHLNRLNAYGHSPRTDGDVAIGRRMSASAHARLSNTLHRITNRCELGILNVDKRGKMSTTTVLRLISMACNNKIQRNDKIARFQSGSIRSIGRCMCAVCPGTRLISIQLPKW